MSQISSPTDPQAGSFFLSLPFEVSREIFFFLDPKALVKYSATCRKARAVVDSHLQECVSRSSQALAFLRGRAREFLAFWQYRNFRVIENPIFQSITGHTKSSIHKKRSVWFAPDARLDHKLCDTTWKAKRAATHRQYMAIAQNFEHLRSCCPQLSFPCYKREELLKLLRAIWIGVACWDEKDIAPQMTTKCFLPYRQEHETTPSCALLDRSHLPRNVYASPEFEGDWTIQVYNATLIHELINVTLEGSPELVEDLCVLK